MLTDNQILEELSKGRISIGNFNIDELNPNSYNVHIGNTYKVIKMESMSGIIDTKQPVEYHELEIPEHGLMLIPGILYLVSTIETITSDYHIPMITGRSSAGRIGIHVHCSAGFGDIGFHGNWTLQLKSTYPTMIYPGQSIAQIYFEEPCGEIGKRYNGKYQHSQGAVGYKTE